MNRDKKPHIETALAEARLCMLGQISDFTDEFGEGDAFNALISAMPAWMGEGEESLGDHALTMFFCDIANAVNEAAEAAFNAAFKIASEALKKEIER